MTTIEMTDEEKLDSLKTAYDELKETVADDPELSLVFWTLENMCDLESRPDVWEAAIPEFIRLSGQQAMQRAAMSQENLDLLLDTE